MADPDHTPPPTLAALFGGFFEAGITGFGGVLPLARRIIVEKRRWLTPAAFTDLLALCQFLPGGNIINLAVALGARFRGLPGAVACVLGLMAAPVAIVIGLGAIYDRFADLPPVRHGFAGLAAAASGLIIATALKIAAPLRADPAGMALALSGFVAIFVLRLPLLPAMAVLTPVGVLIAWWRGATAA